MNKYFKILLAIWFCSTFEHYLSAQPVFPPASQAEVNAGLLHTKFVAPDTLKNNIRTNMNLVFTTNLRPFAASISLSTVFNGHTLTNFTRNFTNWSSGQGTNLIPNVSGTNGYIQVTNNAFYLIGVGASYQYDGNAAIPRTNNFFVTTNVGGVGTNITDIGSRATSTLLTNSVSFSSASIIYLPSNTFVSLGMWDENGIASNSISLKKASLYVMMAPGSFAGSASFSSGGGAGITTNANQFAASVELSIKDGSLQTNNIFRGMTNNGSFSNTANIYNGGTFTNSGAARVAGALDVGAHLTSTTFNNSGVGTNAGNFFMGGNATLTGVLKVNDSGATAAQIAGTVNANNGLVTNILTVSSNYFGQGSNYLHQLVLPRIAANSTLGTDANSNVVAVSSTASTNNAAMFNGYEAVGSLLYTNNLMIPWKAGITNGIWATNGDSQYYNLGANSNFNYFPRSAAAGGIDSDASNHVGVAAAFTQNATGGWYPNINGIDVPIVTNANASTLVYISVVNGATNVSVAYPFNMNKAANYDLIQFDVRSGKYTNGNIISASTVTNSGLLRQIGTSRFEEDIFAQQILATHLLVTNSFRQILALNNVATNSSSSNITVNFGHTNHIDLFITNNITLTNWAGIADGIVSYKTLWIYPQLISRGVNYGNLGLSNPGYSVAIGTNANNALWTTLTNGKIYVLSIAARGTNLFPTLTLWE